MQNWASHNQLYNQLLYKAMTWEGAWGGACPWAGTIHFIEAESFGDEVKGKEKLPLLSLPWMMRNKESFIPCGLESAPKRGAPSSAGILGSAKRSRAVQANPG